MQTIFLSRLLHQQQVLVYTHTLNAGKMIRYHQMGYPRVTTGTETHMVTRTVIRMNIYGQQSYSYGDNSYNNQNDHHSYRNRGGGSRNRQNAHQDYSYGTQWDNKGQPNFLEKQQASMDMGQMVTELMGAMRRMNAGMERLERGQVNRWTH